MNLLNRLISKSKGLDHERVWITFLDDHFEEITTECMAVGGATSVVLRYGIVARRCRQLKCSKIIHTHNHSDILPENHCYNKEGQLWASETDLDHYNWYTKLKKEFTIELVNMYIVGGGSIVSVMPWRLA